ncbi:Phospho-2-dehydro-3-deoxyheptonate aldolase [Phytophthora nicotianae]|uniref:3-deoxy-7-phosphoheptulonate synthase n=1 Tax=Phytophthora nicotianae TaxID=4792 RepID=A0A0W8DKW4_PHYNI|nr:Phospho-2-dehydro-3-deoxyheptonate aldolase [Phytophthora nicotianae]
MTGHDGHLSTSVTLGLGLLAATMTLITAGSVGLVGFMLGRQMPQQETESSSSQKRDKHHEYATQDQERRHRLRIPSGTASEDVKITDKKAIMDVRISGIRPLIPPAILLEEIPLTNKIVQTINRGRQGLANILRRLDDRLVVVVGPCSIHDTDAAMDYVICCQAGCEFLDTMSPQFISDLVSWGAIGARTTECQLHRELCSGLSMPIGFKNGTGGDLQLAVDAVVAAKHSHCFLSVSSQGLAAIVNTSGNDTCHLILRGGKSGPNFEKEHVDDASARMLKSNLVDNVMIDCSHGNSQKKHKNQVKVAANIADQLRAGDDRIVGVMLESNIEEGNQPLTPGKPLVYGKSVTDACMGWETTVEVLRDLAAAVRERRAKNHQ